MTKPASQRNAVPPHAWVELTPGVQAMHDSTDLAYVVDNGDGTVTLEQPATWTVRHADHG